MIDLCWCRFILKDCSAWRGPVLEQGKVQRGQSSREELPWSDCKPHAPSSSDAWGEEGEELETKKQIWAWNIHKVGGRWFIFSLCFSLSNSMLLSNKPVCSKPSLICLWWQLVTDVLAFISTMSFLIMFSPLSYWGGGHERVAGGCQWAGEGQPTIWVW